MESEDWGKMTQNQQNITNLMYIEKEHYHYFILAAQEMQNLFAMSSKEVEDLVKEGPKEEYTNMYSYILGVVIPALKEMEEQETQNQDEEEASEEQA